MAKRLFTVFGPKRIAQGHFSNRDAARRFRDKLNRDYGKGDLNYVWIGPGPDHWRSKLDNAIPLREVGEVGGWVEEENEIAEEVKAVIEYFDEKKIEVLENA